ncbi:MAG: choice-of-anchor Q domain-containing protein, partial [Chthoniobacterales bacterium]
MKTFLLACVLFCLVASVSGETIGIEQFVYADGAIANKTGGTPWNYRNRVPAAHTAGISDWDNVSGAPTVTSGHLVTNNTSAKREYNGPGEGMPIDSDEGLGAINNFNNGTISFQNHVVYYRVLVTTGATVPSTITVTSLDFGTERVSFGVVGFFANDLRFGIWDKPTGATLSNVSAAPNTAYLLVAKLDFVSGQASLYVNPDPTAAENTQTPACTTSFSTQFWSTSVQLGSGTGGSAVTWDDLFVTTTWTELGGIVTTIADEEDGSLGGGTGVSLREAVKYLPDGAVITFAPSLSGQTIVLTRGEIAPNANLTIDASSLPGGLTISGNNSSRLFQVDPVHTLTLRSLTLRDGNAQTVSPAGYGGAIWCNNVVSLFDCTLTDNHATVSAGAIGSTGNVSLTRCTLTGNSATATNSEGGVIAMDTGSLALTDCTISGNTNYGTQGGGALYVGPSCTANLTNTIVAGNTDRSGVAADIRKNSGTINATGTNLIGQNTTVESVFPAGATVGTKTSPLDPKLSLLGYFGGPTMTMHPLVGSPAVDAAGTTNPGGVDQRGLPRFVDGDNSGTAQLDIGAVEAGPLRTVTFLVDNGAGQDLRTVINNSTSPGTHIVFLDGFSAFSYLLFNGEIAVGSKNVFVDASNQAGPVTIDAQTNSRVFGVSSGGTLAMQNINLTNGKATSAFTVLDGNGGAVHNNGTLSLLACTLTGNVSGLGDSSYTGPNIYDSGGALYTS